MDPTPLRPREVHKPDNARDTPDIRRSSTPAQQPRCRSRPVPDALGGRLVLAAVEPFIDRDVLADVIADEDRQRRELRAFLTEWPGTS